MKYKSSQDQRKAWVDFAVNLQTYSVVDLQGKVIPKREVFEKLYDPVNDVQIQLLISGMHWSYKLISRKEYDDAVILQQFINDITQDEIKRLAVNIARKHKLKGRFDETVSMMVNGMLHVLNNHEEINKAIESRLK